MVKVLFRSIDQRTGKPSDVAIHQMPEVPRQAEFFRLPGQSYSYQVRSVCWEVDSPIFNGGTGVVLTYISALE